MCTRSVALKQHRTICCKMALQSRFRKTLDAYSSVIQSLNQHEPLQMSSALGWMAVFLAESYGLERTPGYTSMEWEIAQL